MGGGGGGGGGGVDPPHPIADMRPLRMFYRRLPLFDCMCHENGSVSVHTFNPQYPSIQQYTCSWRKTFFTAHTVCGQGSSTLFLASNESL